MLRLPFYARSAHSVVALFCAALLMTAGCASDSPSSGSGDGDGDGTNDEPSDVGDGSQSSPADATTGAKRDGGAPRLDAGNGGAVSPGGGSTKTDGGGVTSKPDGAGSTSTPEDDAGPAAHASGCTAKLLPLPDDMKARGPWEVGVRTLKIGRLTVEAFYPAQPGSSDGKTAATWVYKSFLPPTQQAKVPDDHSPPIGVLGGHAFRDLPLDEEHGPYPVVIFIHGTASFRVASASTNAHWASRGLIVLAADYPGLGLADQLASTVDCGLPTTGEQDLPSDVTLQLNALKTPTGDTQFFAGHVDTSRVGISGHSQGACEAATQATDPGVRIVLPLDGSNPAADSDTLESVIFVSGVDDMVIGYSAPLIGNVVCPIGSFTTESAYDGSPGPPKVKKRIVGITGGGHLVPTDLCQVNAQGKTAIKESQDDGVCGVDSAVIIGLPALFDCGTIDWKVGVEAVNYATAAALEETLLCQDRSAQFASLQKNLPQVGDFHESVK
jgi:hypothetical protein